MADEASSGSLPGARRAIDRPTKREARAAPRRHGPALILSLGLLLLGLAGSIAPAPRTRDSAGPVFVVQIQGEIDLGMAPYLKRIVDQAKRENARAVILEIDTPGGRLDAVLQMRETILASPVRTIAFVNRTAFSAGALIVIAADEVAMAPGGVIGAATPVSGAGESADEKTISAVRTTFRSTAELRGRDPRLAEAMVDPSVAIDGLTRQGQLLTLTTTDALTWGYADHVTADRQALLQATGLAEATLQETAPALAETIVRFLTSPLIASLLISVGLLLIISNLLAGGIGIASGIGLGLLAIFFWGHLLAGLAGWEGIGLVLLGLVLIGLEIFVIPGFGVAGVLGLAALLAGLFFSLIGGEIVTTDDLVRAGSTIGLALLIGLAGGALLLWLLPRTTRFEGLVLRASVGMPANRSQLGRRGKRALVPRLSQTAPGSESPSPPPPAPPPTTSLVGARGVALTDLRPAGFARIRGERVDVVTQGDYLVAGEAIEVISDEGYRRVVRPVEDGKEDLKTDSNEQAGE